MGSSITKLTVKQCSEKVRSLASEFLDIMYQADHLVRVWNKFLEVNEIPLRAVMQNFNIEFSYNSILLDIEIPKLSKDFKTGVHSLIMDLFTSKESSNIHLSKNFTITDVLITCNHCTVVHSLYNYFTIQDWDEIEGKFSEEIVEELYYQLSYCIPYLKPFEKTEPSELLQEVVRYINSQDTQLCPVYSTPYIYLSAYLHCLFRSLPLFSDHNEKFARLLTNLWNLENYLPPILFRFEDKDKYEEAYKYYKQTSDPSKMFIFFCEQIEYSLKAANNSIITDLRDNYFISQESGCFFHKDTRQVYEEMEHDY